MEEDSSTEWKTCAFDQVSLTNVPLPVYHCYFYVNSQLSTAFDTDAAVVGSSQDNELRKLTIVTRLDVYSSTMWCVSL